jgi:hypothetical protein
MRRCPFEKLDIGGRGGTRAGYSIKWILASIVLGYVANATASGEFILAYCSEHNVNLLKTKRRQLYLKAQFVPRCKHVTTLLQTQSV